MGFKPMPLAVRELEGRRGHRTKEELNLYNQATPEPTLSLDPPEYLSEQAQIEWRKLAPILYRNLLFTEIDEEQFALFCAAWGRWVDLQYELLTAPTLVNNYRGDLVINPLHKASMLLSDQVAKYLQQFGMSPAARMRVTTAKKKDKKDRGDDAWAKLAEQRKKINEQLKNNPLPDIDLNDDKSNED